MKLARGSSGIHSWWSSTRQYFAFLSCNVEKRQIDSWGTWKKVVEGMIQEKDKRGFRGRVFFNSFLRKQFETQQRNKHVYIQSNELTKRNRQQAVWILKGEAKKNTLAIESEFRMNIFLEDPNEKRLHIHCSTDHKIKSTTKKCLVLSSSSSFSFCFFHRDTVSSCEEYEIKSLEQNKI